MKLREIAPNLKFYKTPSRKPSFLNSLMATLDECGNYGVSPKVLINCAHSFITASLSDKD